LGKAEDEYTQLQMQRGKLTQLLVTEDHKRYWMVFAVADETELRNILENFPMHKYFNYKVNSVVDIVAMVAAGIKGPTG